MKEWKLLTHPLLLPYAGEDQSSPEPEIHYKIIYRSGTVKSYQWQELHGSYLIEKANSMAAGLRDRGLRPELVPEGVYDKQGLPNTFRAHNFYRSP